MDGWNIGTQKVLEDGRVWNSLCYVHNEPKDGCSCDTCVGFFPPLPKFKVGQMVTARAFVDCFKEAHAERANLTVRQIVRIQPDFKLPLALAPYYRVKATDPTGGYFEASERFFDPA